MYIRRAQYTRRALVITQFNAARAQVSRLCRSRVCVPTVPPPHPPSYFQSWIIADITLLGGQQWQSTEGLSSSTVELRTELVAKSCIHIYELEILLFARVFPQRVLSLQEGFSSGGFPLGIMGHDPLNLCSKWCWAPSSLLYYKLFY